MRQFESVIQKTIWTIVFVLACAAANPFALHAFAAPGDSDDWHAIGTPGFSAANANYTSLAFDGDTPYVAFQDGNVSNKATVMRYANGSWAAVGTPGFSAANVSFVKLAISAGAPYVAYQDNAYGGRTTVMKYDGTNWVYVGTPGFSAGQTSFVALNFYNGTPYTAYLDNGNSGRATVMKYTGSAWVNVGNAAFSAGQAYATSIDFASDGTPYVAFQDHANAQKATVMKYDGTNWSVVGMAGFTAGQADDVWVQVDGATPYVGYRDGTNSSKATVAKFDGTNWVAVGGAASPNIAYGMSFTMHSGTPYVAYADGVSGGRATVAKFVSGSWQIIGTAQFSSGGQAGDLSLKIHNGTPVVAYRDPGNGNKATVMAYGTQTAQLTNAVNNKAIQVTVPGASSITCANSIDTQSIPLQGDGYTFPLGMVRLCFTTTQQTSQVQLVFETDLTPSEFVARDYNPSTQAWLTITGATITETTLGGAHALQLTYAVTDGGPLDADATTGSIIDPVGLGLAIPPPQPPSNGGGPAGGTQNGAQNHANPVPGAPDTGLPRASGAAFVGMIAMGAGVAALGVALYLRRIRRKAPAVRPGGLKL